MLLIFIMSETSSQMEKCKCDYSYLRNKKGPKFQGQSTNKATYKAYQLEKPVSFDMPKPKEKHYDASLLQSSYKLQYQKPNAALSANDSANNQDFIKSYQQRKAKVPFSSETQYKKSFDPKPVQIQKQPIYEYKPKNIKFEGSSSYKNQFTEKKNPDLLSSAGQEIVNYSREYQNNKNKVKFEGQSSYKANFTKYDVKVEKQPAYEYKPKNTRLEGQSSYKQTFTAPSKEVYKSQYDNCPIHPDRVAIK